MPEHTLITTEQQIREILQPLLKDAQMQSWHEGVQKGLKIAHSLIEATRNEVARRADTGNECEQAQREAQIAALGALMAALTKASDEAISVELP